MLYFCYGKSACLLIIFLIYLHFTCARSLQCLIALVSIWGITSSLVCLAGVVLLRSILQSTDALVHRPRSKYSIPTSLLQKRRRFWLRHALLPIWSIPTSCVSSISMCKKVPPFSSWATRPTVPCANVIPKVRACLHISCSTT